MAFGACEDLRGVTTHSIWKNQGWVGRDQSKNLNPVDTDNRVVKTWGGSLGG